MCFALKISLCATICYIIYHAIDWPGISTSVTTVMITGLVTTGAMKQKLAFRLLGATVGGLVLGIGTEVFLFPYMDSITSLVILVGAVAFLWIGAGDLAMLGSRLLLPFTLCRFQDSRHPSNWPRRVTASRASCWR